MAATQLDPAHFKLIKEQVAGEYCYQAYQPVNAQSTIVLFSIATGTPICSFSLAPTGAQKQSVITQRPAPQGNDNNGGNNSNNNEAIATTSYFQAMISDESEFSFTVSNLTTLAPLMVDVLDHPDYDGMRINEINVLEPSRSSRTEGDARNRRSLMLKGAKSSQGAAVSVQADEKEAADKGKRVGEGTKGTYFYITVQPSDSSAALLELFKQGTAWRAVDMVVRKVHTPKPIPRFSRVPTSNLRRGRGGPSGMARTSQSRQSRRVSRSRSRSRSGSRGPSPSSDVVRRYRSRSRSRGRDSAAEVEAEALCEELCEAEEEEAFAPEEQEQDNRGGDVVRARTRHRWDASCPTSTSESFRARRKSKSSSSSSSSRVSSATVFSSQAGSLVAGQREVIERGRACTDSFSQEHTGQPCVIGLSIWRGMQLAPTLLADQAASDAIADMVTNENKQLVLRLTKVFKSEECVICLGQEPIDTVFVQCGHACVHADCVKGGGGDIKECPLCRQRVLAVVPTSLLEGEGSTQKEGKQKA